MKMNSGTQAKGESWEGFEEEWLFFVVLKIKKCLVEVLMLEARATFNFWLQKGLCTTSPATLLPKAATCSLRYDAIRLRAER